jgi:hypothetical protein
MIPENARTLRPLVWQDENSYCVLLGPDPKAGVFACGETVRSALKNWDTNLKSVLATKKTGSELAQFIQDALNASVYDIN